MQPGTEEAILSLSVSLATDSSQKERFQKLVGFIEDLLQQDFSAVVYLLYRVDVNESKLRQVLAMNPGKDAAVIIAQLLIERQAEKIKTRKAYQRPADEIPPEEKW